MPLVAARRGVRSADVPPEVAGGNATTTSPTTLGGDRLRHVMRALETVENGLLPDMRVLELFACDRAASARRC